MVEAQLVEGSLPTPEIRSSNPDVEKCYLPIEHLNRKDKIKEKEAWKDPSKKQKAIALCVIEVRLDWVRITLRGTKSAALLTWLGMDKVCARRR